MSQNSFLIVLAISVAGTCQAAFTFLPPTPYLSAADSPFPVLTDPTFALEDFEDDSDCVPGPGVFCGGVGKFDAPGVSLINGSTGGGASVDADDGLIDGQGNSSASGQAGLIFTTGNADYSAFEFEFDAAQLGCFPTAVGFVVTSGAGSMSGITVFDAFGGSAILSTNDLLLDPNTTSDDRFVAILNPLGISRVSVGKTTIAGALYQSTPRIDHLQYGLLVPEPSGSLLIASAAALLVVRGLLKRKP